MEIKLNLQPNLVFFSPNKNKLKIRENTFKISIITEESIIFWVIIDIPFAPPNTMFFLKKNKLYATA